MSYDEHTLAQIFQSWWSKSTADTIKDWLRIILLGVVLWFIWKVRNKAIFEEYKVSAKFVIADIKRYVIDLFKAHKLLLPGGDKSEECVLFF